MTTLLLEYGKVQVKESYTTVRNRLLNVHDFIELTVDGKRKLYSKLEIKEVSTQEPEQPKTKAKKK